MEGMCEITDKERREAARGLRSFARDEMDGGNLLRTLKLAICVSGTWRDVLLRLADLVEPDSTLDAERLRRENELLYNEIVRLNAQTCSADRGALLALADEVRGVQAFCVDDTVGVARRVLLDWSRRIREACGEEAGA